MFVCAPRSHSSAFTTCQFRDHTALERFGRSDARNQVPLDGSDLALEFGKVVPDFGDLGPIYGRGNVGELLVEVIDVLDYGFEARQIYWGRGRCEERDVGREGRTSRRRNAYASPSSSNQDCN